MQVHGAGGPHAADWTPKGRKAAEQGIATTEAGAVEGPAAEPINPKAAKQIDHMLAHGPFRRIEGDLERRIAAAGIGEEASAQIYGAREEFLATVEELRGRYVADPHPGAHGHFRRDVMRALNDLRASIRAATRAPEPEVGDAGAVADPAIEGEVTAGEVAPLAVSAPEAVATPIPVEPVDTIVVDLADDLLIDLTPEIVTEAYLLEGVLGSLQTDPISFSETT